MELYVGVRKSMRGRGLGRSISCELARSLENTSQVILTTTCDAIPEGGEVVRALGGTEVSRSRHYQHDLFAARQTHEQTDGTSPGIRLRRVRGAYTRVLWPDVLALREVVFPNHDLESVEKSLSGTGLTRLSVLALNGERVVGLHEVLLWERYAMVHVTAVTPSMRRRGIARLVKDDMLMWLRREHSQIRDMWTIIEETNPAAEHLNESVGFKLASTIRTWQLDCRVVLASLLDRSGSLGDARCLSR